MVEDDQASRKALRAILTRQGWEVSTASCLAEAWPLLHPEVAVLILDLMLPDGEGSDLLAHLRANGWPTKVIVTTGSSDSARLARIRQLNPDFLLFKPLELDRLLEAIRRS